MLDPCRSNGLVLKLAPENTPVSRRNVKSAELVAELRALLQSLNEVPAAEDEELVVYCEAFCEETNAANGDASLSAKMKGPGLLRSWTGPCLDERIGSWRPLSIHGCAVRKYIRADAFGYVLRFAN